MLPRAKFSTRRDFSWSHCASHSAKCQSRGGNVVMQHAGRQSWNTGAKGTHHWHRIASDSDDVHITPMPPCVAAALDHDTHRGFRQRSVAIACAALFLDRHGVAAISTRPSSALGKCQQCASVRAHYRGNANASASSLAVLKDLADKAYRLLYSILRFQSR